MTEMNAEVTDIADAKVNEPDIALKHRFKYHSSQGGEETAKFIRIKAFNMKQMHLADPVKEIAMKAYHRLGEKNALSDLDVEEVKELKDKTKKNQAMNPDEMEGVDMVNAISMFGDEGDLGKFHGHMRKLLTSGVAYIDGSTKLTGTYIDDFNTQDFDNLCGQYLGNFIV